MRKLLAIYLILVGAHFSWGQTFSSTTSSNLTPNYNYLANGIDVTGLSILDGVSLSVTSVKLNISGGINLAGNRNTKIDLYVVSPSGQAAYLMYNDLYLQNGEFVFSALATNPINYTPFTNLASIANPYQPRVNLNALNLGEPANGKWRLYAKNNGIPATINSWEITFGTSATMTKGAMNSSCPFSIALENTTLTGNSVSGNNTYNGIVLNASNPQPQASQSLIESNSSDPMQTGIWHSFNPKCKNDRIEITGFNGYISSGIAHGTCNSLTRDNILGSFIDATVSHNFTNYTPGQTYYLILDGDHGDYFRYTVKWYEGTIGCMQSNTITTIDPSKNSYCIGDTMTVKYSISGIYTPGNKFTAQISDLNGSFANPVIIGFALGNLAGSIQATLPFNLPAGLGYKVRVVSDNPQASSVTQSNGFQIQTVPTVPRNFDGPLVVCPGQQNVPFSTSALPGTLRFRWTFPPQTMLVSSTSDSSNVMVSFGTIGGLVTLQGVNTCGESLPFEKNIEIKPSYTPIVTLSGDSSVCVGSAATFRALTTHGGDAPIFTWWVNQVQQTQLSAVDSTFSLLTFQESDTVQVQLKSSKDCAFPSIVSHIPHVVKSIASVVPSIFINGGTEVCQGVPATFNAIATGAGPSPTYQWNINRSEVGTQASYSNSTWRNNDTLTVTMRSSEPCATSSSITSIPVLIKVKERKKATINILKLKEGYCAGDTFSFVASPSVEALSSKFQWSINGQAIGDSTDNLVASHLKDGDTVFIRMTTDELCLEAIDTFLLIQLEDTIPVRISLLGDSSICPSDTSIYTVHSAPYVSLLLYNWYVNGVIQSASDSSIQLQMQENDTVWATIRSTEKCVRPKNAHTSKIVIKTAVSKIPIVTIQGPANSCIGDSLLYSATMTNGGNHPSFQWFVNNSPQFNDTLPLFISGSLNDKDTVYVQAKSSLDCASLQWVQSAKIGLSVLPNIVPTLNLKGDIVYCQYQPLLFQAEFVAETRLPRFSWFVDGNLWPNDTLPLLRIPSLSSGSHEITVKMEKTGKCVLPDSAADTVTFLLSDSVKTELFITGDSSLCQGSTGTYQLSTALSSNQANYLWQVNGTELGGNEPVLVLEQPKDGDSISLFVETQERCISELSKHSNVLVIKVTPAIVPTVSIQVSPLEICKGEEVFYQALVDNRGTNPQFDWTLNGQSQLKSENDTFTSQTSQNDEISVHFSTSLPCGTYSSEHLAPPIQIKVKPLLSSISGPKEVCQASEVLFNTEQIQGAQYEWIFPITTKTEVEGNRITIIPLSNFQIDTLKVSASNECGEGNQIMIVLQPGDCEAIFVPNGLVSSDASGNNLWQIKGLGKYPNATVQVFNRWGDKVFKSQGYPTPWDGSFKDRLLPTGTYYYLIEGVGGKPMTGDLTIVH